MGCEDVLEPELRDRAEHARTTFVTAAEQAATFLGKLDLVTSDSATKELLWERIREAGAS